MQPIRTITSLAAATLLCVASPSLRAQDGGIEIGARAPVRTLNNTDGKPVNLADFIGKKPVLIEFWATWCENCKALEPSMLKAHKKYGAQIEFIGVAVAINQTLDRVQKYVQKYKYTYPMLWDAVGDCAAAYDVPATSFVVIIDKSGKVVYTGSGGKQDLDAAIGKALPRTSRGLQR